MEVAAAYDGPAASKSEHPKPATLCHKLSRRSTHHKDIKPALFSNYVRKKAHIPDYMTCLYSGMKDDVFDPLSESTATLIVCIRTKNHEQLQDDLNYWNCWIELVSVMEKAQFGAWTSDICILARNYYAFHHQHVISLPISFAILLKCPVTCDLSSSHPCKEESYSASTFLWRTALCNTSTAHKEICMDRRPKQLCII